MTQSISDPTAPHLTDEHAQRAAKLEKIEKDFGSPFHITKFDRTHTAAQIKKTFDHLKPGEETDHILTVAGRVMAIRNNGMFIDVLDETDRVQVFHHLKELKEPQAALLKLLDLGDIIGVKGHMRRTPRGELSISSHETVLLSKALEPPPEKYHGLKNIEARFRHREQDIVSNEQTRVTLRARYQLVSVLRQYLYEQGWLEVETPMLHVMAGGALAKPFVTHHNALDMPLYLRIAPELHLKRLVIGGLADKVFEINRNFRNEGISHKHNPEFTMIELYWAFVDFKAMMQLTELLITTVIKKIHGTTKIKVQDREIEFASPWPVKSMTSLIQEHTGFDFETEKNSVKALKKAKELGVPLESGLSWGQIVESVFGEKVEKNLIQPTHVIDYPKDISPLAKAYPDRPWLAQRFETFANGMEIANGFSELNDPREQRARFLEQAEQKRGPDDPPHPIDEDFIKAMAFGMPPMGGVGIGIDRLGMLLTDSPSIREVIAFPTLRPAQGSEK